MPALRSQSKRFAQQTLQPVSGKEHCTTASNSPITKKNLLSKLDEITENVQHNYTKVAGSTPPAANITPPEILLQIYSLMTPRDFNNARRTCSQWMRVSLNKDLLETMLKRAGWWDAWRHDSMTQRVYRNPSSYESEVWRMSKRFATECLLSGRSTVFEKPGFVTTGSIDFSQLAASLPRMKTRGATTSLHGLNSHSASTFSVSSCGKYLLTTTGCMVYVFRLLDKDSRSMSLADSNVIPITSISCPFEVLSATIDTTSSPFVIAALLRNRAGMVCDLYVSNIIYDFAGSTAGSVDEAPESLSSKPAKHNLYSMPTTAHLTPHYFQDVCSDDHPPRTIALCPGRRCVAFGCAGGIEIHWIDENTQTAQRRHFPMSQPSEILHFLPNSPKVPTEMRLISSLAGPGVHECSCRQSPFPDHPKKCQFNFLGDSKSSIRNPPNHSSLSLVRATHCHHYRAMPVHDGYHIIFIEPRTGLLCIGSDAPIGGPTSLTRAFVCVPPGSTKYQPDVSTEQARVPTAFAIASDLSWGLRVVAAYRDHIVLYSIPLDLLNIIRKERERQSDGFMGDDQARDWATGTDPGEFRQRRENLIQNDNGDWEFVLSARYKAPSMTWPFKVHGKEIGRMDNIVELALQSSNGGARIWAFGASGSARIFDIDTFTSTSAEPEPASDQFPTAPDNIPMKMVTLGSDGSVISATISERGTPGFRLETGSRKRKASALRDSFMGRYGASRYVSCKMVDGLRPVNALRIQEDDSSDLRRRPSFAACIVDFKIPGLGVRGGGWKNE
ncbi:hypothetical protein N7466_008828 [Penicillium verhagenii]|uniref:uncharacterized protein n=1 Tax=Penicillium verhagenii TaxID=1562060 RepID=UPI0025453911|nr:uncharacterized protein N7466_008828 [Penicillium verhagenii]KAJ5924641.1 hypothetical protein N7466_008828 [Penicillium verhagenii]